MKLLALALFISTFTLSAFAENANLCKSSQSKAEAKRALQMVTTLANQNGFSGLVMSSGYETCNPNGFRFNYVPGQMGSKISYPNVCGAIFTFAQSAAMQEFIKKVKAAQLPTDVSTKICVQMNGADPR